MLPGIVERTKVTVERTTTDIEVKANICDEDNYDKDNYCDDNCYDDE